MMRMIPSPHVMPRLNVIPAEAGIQKDGVVN